MKKIKSSAAMLKQATDVVFNIIVTIIKFPLYQNFSALCENSSDPAVNVIGKCKCHSIIVAIK